jgi:hypothetical protein
MRRSILGGLAMSVAAIAMAQTQAPGLERVVGHYRFASGQIFSVERSGESVSVKSRGMPQSVLTKSADGKFSFPASENFLSFDIAASGSVSALQYHFDGGTYAASRINDAAFMADSEAWQLKIKNQTHAPDCAMSVRRMIDETRAGNPDYSKLSPLLSRAVRAQTPVLQPRFEAAGATKDVKFISVDATGNEIFEATHENGSVTTWRVLCLPNGYVAAAAFRL